MKKKIGFLGRRALLMFALLLTFSVHSSELEAKKPLDMLTLSQIPYGFVTAEGDTSGVLYQILNEIMVLSTIGKYNNLVPFKRILAKIRAKHRFCTIAAGTTASAELFDLVEPIGYQMSAGILPVKGIDLVDHDSLKNLKIAVPLGAHIEEKFNNDNDLHKVIPSKFINAMKMLKSGRVDAVAGTMQALTYIAKTQGLTKDDFGKPLIYEPFDLYLLCSYGIAADIRYKLKNALIELKTKGKVQQILDNYSWDVQD
jgi:ABC-type amino acid transport substrate-binding protein